MTTTEPATVDLVEYRPGHYSIRYGHPAGLTLLVTPDRRRDRWVVWNSDSLNTLHTSSTVQGALAYAQRVAAKRVAEYSAGTPMFDGAFTVSAAPTGVVDDGTCRRI